MSNKKTTEEKKLSATEVVTAITTKNFSREQIPQFLEVITKSIEVFQGGKSKKDTVTTNALGDFGKVKDIKKVSTLIKAYASVQAREEAYNKAAKEIIPEKIKTPALTIDGHAPSTWKSHIQSRVVEVSNANKIAKLNEFKAILEKNLSEDEKFKRDMAKVAAGLAEDINMD